MHQARVPENKEVTYRTYQDSHRAGIVAVDHAGKLQRYLHRSGELCESSDYALQITYGLARRGGLRGAHDGLGVNSIVPIDIGNRSGLAKTLDPERSRDIDRP